VSYHEHNEKRRASELVKRLAGGDDIALVSDAGTPGVSDPGYRLVNEARTKGLMIRSIPGPSAALAALAVSGLPTSSFCFLGFLPTKPGARRRAIDALAGMPHTLVLFESARRAPSLLEQLSHRLGSREGFLARELTKIHEEHRAGTLPELAQWVRETALRGELTIIVSGAGKNPAIPTSGTTLESLDKRLETLMGRGLSRREAAKQIAKETGLASRDIYKRANRSDASEKGDAS
jgi:16S rRNA (cytidine1402-2'-O)-methyltransferase